MVMQSSGQIKLSEIATEFGGSAPHTMSEYYGSDTVPASGEITMSDFYGTSNTTYTVATGGTITTYGNYKIHTFNSSSTFTVTTLGTDDTVEYLVVAGGGAGDVGGGGAGGYRTASGYVVSTLGYTVTVGGGGSGSGSPEAAGSGSNSVFDTITSTGGGAGSNGIAGGSE